jgi:hypothetical protein
MKLTLLLVDDRELAQLFRIIIRAVAPSLSLRSVQRQGGDFDLLASIPNAGIVEEESHSKGTPHSNPGLALTGYAVGS